MKALIILLFLHSCVALHDPVIYKDTEQLVEEVLKDEMARRKVKEPDTLIGCFEISILKF
jgi:hypothetical protein